MLVSHDRYLIDRLTDQLFIFEGDGNVQIYSGNYTDYRLEQEELKKPKEYQKQPEKVTKPAAGKRKSSFKEEKEIKDLEASIKELEKEVLKLTMQLNSGILDHNELSEIAIMVRVKKEEMDAKTLRWLELTDI